MNKRKSTIFIFLILAFLIVSGFGNEVFSGSTSPFTTTTFDGVIDITTDKCKYKQGETVTVFITNIGEDKIEIGGPCFNVYTENRETVFSGCLFCYWKLEPGERETWYWNQIDKNWSQVPIGKYIIEGIFPTASEDKKYYDETSIYIYKNKNLVRNNPNEKELPDDTTLSFWTLSHVRINGTGAYFIGGSHFFQGIGGCTLVITSLEEDGCMKITSLLDTSNSIQIEGKNKLVMLGFIGFHCSQKGVYINGMALFALKTPR